jgi:hypothetical protein
LRREPKAPELPPPDQPGDAPSPAATPSLSAMLPKDLKFKNPFKS